MSARFNERKSKLARALVSLDPKSDTFLDAKAIQPLLDLTNSMIVDTECSVAIKQYFATVTGGNDKKMTASRLISDHHGVL